LFPDYVSEEFLRAASPEDATLGFLFEQDGKKLFIANSLSGENAEWKKLAASADVTLIDGTFWSNDELLRTRRTNKTAREIGHLPLSWAARFSSTSTIQIPSSMRIRRSTARYWKPALKSPTMASTFLYE
jgi:hypothetical protein